MVTEKSWWNVSDRVCRCSRSQTISSVVSLKLQVDPHSCTTDTALTMSEERMTQTCLVLVSMGQSKSFVMVVLPSCIVSIFKMRQ